DGVHNESVLFPMTDGVAVIAGLEILRMRTAVHVNRPVGVRSTDIKNVHTLDFRHIDELYAVGRDELSRTSGDFAARVGLITFLWCRCPHTRDQSSSSAPP